MKWRAKIGLYHHFLVHIFSRMLEILKRSDDAGSFASAKVRHKFAQTASKSRVSAEAKAAVSKLNQHQNSCMPCPTQPVTIRYKCGWIYFRLVRELEGYSGPSIYTALAARAQTAAGENAHLFSAAVLKHDPPVFKRADGRDSYHFNIFPSDAVSEY